VGVAVEVGAAAGAGFDVAAGVGAAGGAGAEVCARRTGVASKNPKAIHLRVRGIKNLPVFARGCWFRRNCAMADSTTAIERSTALFLARR
jgi:hypothetical protein